MNDKYSPEIQVELNKIIGDIKKWKNIFDSKIEFYYDGWAIFLREKNSYPRVITIFKSYKKKKYSIKSFEVTLKDLQKEEFEELYSIENIENINELLHELKDIIYGKDLIKEVSEIHGNSFLN
ncbi:MAG: hypothetical protein ACFFCE_19925 [Promethearchaeota archaeon]